MQNPVINTATELIFPDPISPERIAFLINAKGIAPEVAEIDFELLKQKLQDPEEGMGTVGDPKFRLDIVGRARAFHFFNSSDERYKKDINTISNPLETIMKLRGVTYKLYVNIDKYSTDKNNFTETKNNTIQNDESINIQSI